ELFRVHGAAQLAVSYRRPRRIQCDSVRRAACSTVYRLWRDNPARRIQLAAIQTRASDGAEAAAVQPGPVVFRRLLWWEARSGDLERRVESDGAVHRGVHR